MTKRKPDEFNSIIGKYANHPKVLEMKNYTHHGIRRYDHCFRVAYHTYKLTKLLHLNYASATKAAMLHDFYTDELLQEKSSIVRFQTHPEIAVQNAKKYFEINEEEEDIILNHMFPITKTRPKHLEGWIVDMIDDGISIYEKCYSIRKTVSAYANLAVIMFITFLR